MSKGLGKVEQYILNEISQKKYCLIKDVPFKQPSVSRAAKRLLTKNLINYYTILLKLPDKRKRWVGYKGQPVHHTVCIAVSPDCTDKQLYEIRTENNLFPTTDKERMSYEQYEAGLKSLMNLRF